MYYFSYKFFEVWVVGRHLLEISSLKDSRYWLFNFDEKRCLQKKAFAFKKSV
jgi:hypothetical protein